MHLLDQLRITLGDVYTIDRELPRIALGECIAGESSDGDRVTICVVDRKYVERMDDPERFVRELERARTLRHDALVPLAGAGVTPDGMVYYATSLTALAGHETARQRLARTGPIPAAEIAAIGRRLAGALAAVHAARVLHGCVTLECVHLAPTGARLSGTGLYDALLASGLDRGTVTALLAGSEATSPEQRMGRPSDGRTDVYALGAALYELLTGKRPLGGRTTRSVMASVLADEPPAYAPATRILGGRDATGHTVEAVLRAIEQSPEDRWNTAARFEAALATQSDSRQSESPDTENPLAAMVSFLRLGTAKLLRR